MWKQVPTSYAELNLDIVLGSGQSFRWKRNQSNEWQGVLCNLVWTLKQEKDGNLLYYTHEGSETPHKTKKTQSAKRQKLSASTEEAFDHESILKDYFNLNLSAADLYASWSAADNNFKEIAKNFKGVRILRQDPVENLFSFICSANNNIPRITSMVENLCIHFGQKLCDFQGQSFYSFPSIKSLAQKGVEQKLRELVFGYRAKYISQAAQELAKRNPNWLWSLRLLDYQGAHSELMKLPGIGAKVADCICLMSLDKLEAIPVDTHIWQVTVRDYLPNLKAAKTMTPKIYKEIGDFYRERFGKYAGWANTVLFAADLKKFKKIENI